MPSSTITLTLQNPAYGPNNSATISAHVRKENNDLPGRDELELAYVLMAFAVAASPNIHQAEILGAASRPLGDPAGGGSTPIAWNTAAANAVKAKFTADAPAGVIAPDWGTLAGPPPAKDWPGEHAPVGTSTMLQGISNIPGRKGRKRLYLPFTGTLAISNAGGYSATTMAQTLAAWNYFVREWNAPLVKYNVTTGVIAPYVTDSPLVPNIEIKVGGTQLEFTTGGQTEQGVITQWRAGRTPARLRSRTR